jgi:uncharacterized membrane protein YedE/YeeE
MRHDRCPVPDLLTKPWPWYVAGPIIGLFVPALLLVGNRQFGVSSNLRHLCAAIVPGSVDYFRYDWRRSGLWNLAFLLGILAGGYVAAGFLGPLSLVPLDVFNWSTLLTARGFVIMVAGGFLVGFGTAYAGGCTSGHGVLGLASFQLPSLLAVVGFFAGGALCTYVILPLLL